MSIVKGIRSYIEDNDMRIIIQNNKIDILNYKDIGHFDSNKVMIKCENKRIVVEGENLVVSKLLDDEVLITGECNKIEFR